MPLNNRSRGRGGLRKAAGSLRSPAALLSGPAAEHGVKRPPISIGGNVYRYRCSSRCHRTIFLLLIAACGSGCHVWRAQPPSQTMAYRQTSKLRITRHSGSTVILEQPTIRGDTIHGIVRSSQSAGEVRIPLSDVREVATRHLSAWRTTAIVTGVATGFAAGAYMAAVKHCLSTQRDC